VATRRCAIFAIVLALGMGVEAGAAHAQARPDTGILCPSPDDAIRPGESIGPIAIGMTIRQASQTLHAKFVPSGVSQNGRPVGRNGQDISVTPDHSWTWSAPFFEPHPIPGLVLTTHGDRIVMVSLSSNAGLAVALGQHPVPSPFAVCRTKRGLHLGNTKEDVRTMYGEPPSTNDFGGNTYWLYNDLGLLVGFDWVTAGAQHSPVTVTTIAVFTAGRFCDAADARAHIIGGATLDEGFACQRFSPTP
jgi:hypothetical protein